MPDNASIVAFNARLRSEYLNASWLLSIADSRSRIESWREDYSQHRPHTSLGNVTPAEFADQLKNAPKRS